MGFVQQPAGFLWPWIIHVFYFIWSQREYPHSPGHAVCPWRSLAHSLLHFGHIRKPKPMGRAWLALVLRGFKRFFALSDSCVHLLPPFCAADKKNELVHELQMGLKFLRRPAHFAQFIAYKHGCDLQNYCWLFEFPAFLPGEKQSLPAAIREHFISATIHYLYFEQKRATCCHK